MKIAVDDYDDINDVHDMILMMMIMMKILILMTMTRITIQEDECYDHDDKTQKKKII